MELFRTKDPLPGLQRSESSGVTLAVLLFSVAPAVARAAVPSERFEFGMYGRVGFATNFRGQLIQGRSLNVIDSKGLGGRLEEGDYIEPTFRAYLVKPKETGDLDVSMTLNLAFSPASGTFIQNVASGSPLPLDAKLAQAMVEAKNLGVRDLEVWGGARNYRGDSVHIADYFYFNDLSGQGGGFKYKGLDVAVILRTAAAPDPLYNADSDLDGEFDVRRQRMVYVGQYRWGLGGGASYMQGLAEYHLLPPMRTAAGISLARGDNGAVLGAKLHLATPDGSFSDTSVRYGTGIANGAWGGSRTYETFGAPDMPNPNGGYQWFDAYGLEVVEHYLWNANRVFALNGYGALHVNRGASGAPEDKLMDWSVGARSFIYVTDGFHLINEATYQERKNGEDATGSAVKLSVVPTLAFTAERGAFVRPHLRLIYTVAFYNAAARNGLMSPYLRAFGPTSTGHYLGLRTEWWF